MRRSQLWWIWVTLVVFATAAFVGAQAPQKDEIIKSLNFQNADIHSVLNFLAEYANVNIVTTPGVQGNVTFNLQNVTWDQALEIVTKTYGLTAVQENGYVRVVPTSEYQAERAADAKSNVEHQQLVPLTTEIVKIGYAAADELIQPTKSLLTERGTVEADKRTNSLIIREVPENLPHLLQFVTSLDRPIQQIKISAKLVEISTSDLFEMGVRWSLSGQSTIDGNPANTYGAVEADKVSDKVGQFTFDALTNGVNIEAALSLLSSTGKVKVVAHPEITTVDNNEARIQLGQKIPIKQFDEAGNVVIEFTEVGTILRVTPHITAENKILMHLYPERSTYAFDPNGVIINTSNAETKVVVDNGQTVVIGGLTTQDVTESHVGVPILKDIPLLGYLFSYKQRKTEDHDLVIFVTPTVVTGEDMSMQSAVEAPNGVDLN
jgi:type IV pilus secretin PilQ/predicted competence protein